MTVLFTQHWDVAINRHADYSDYVMTVYNPGMAKIGLPIVGGYYVTVGPGPRIIAVASADNLGEVQKALEADKYQELLRGLMGFVTNYTSRIMVPTGRVMMDAYKVGLGVWKFNQHWNIVPGAEAEYTSYVTGEYLPTMEKLGLKVVGGWQVIVGMGPHILSESSAPGIVDIAKAIDTNDFRRVMQKLKTHYITDYHSRILSPSGRIEVPFFMAEMMKGF